MPRTKLVNGVEVPFTPEEEAARDAEELEWETNVRSVEERERLFKRAFREAVDSLLDEEIAVLRDAYNETQRYRIDNTTATPTIDGMQTVFTGLTKAQIGTRIESKMQNYLFNAGAALATKLKDETP